MPLLMEVIEYLDPSGDVMVARVPAQGEVEIKWGAQVTVRESQSAVFFRDGKVQAVLGVGRHVLTTQNVPIITKWITSFGYGPKSPFRAEVYFVNQKLFRELRWGTREPILFHDNELNTIRLRSHGIFSIQIKEPSLFVNRIVGTQNLFNSSDIHSYLRTIIVSKFIAILGNHLKSIFELPKYYDSLSGILKASVADDFRASGLELLDFYIDAITLPEEVQKIVDERTSMEAIGDMNKYMKFKTAKSIEEAAKQSNGLAGGGIGLGAGLGMGMMFPGLIKEALKGEDNNLGVDAFDKIKKLKELLDSRAITQDDFDNKKAELLKGIT